MKQFEPNTEIDVSDLKYKSENELYYSEYTYYGDGVFLLASKGVIDHVILKKQIELGDKARERLNSKYPNKQYHLLWDLSEINRSTLFSRHTVLNYLSTANKYASISIIGSNLFFKSFTIIVSKLISNLNLYFFQTSNEALKFYSENLNKVINLPQNNGLHISVETDSYSRFISLWQLKPQFITINNNKYKIVSRPTWNYAASDGSYKTSIKVIEGNIIYYQTEGYARTNNIDATYGILESIMHDLGFNASENKFYSVLNLSKLKGITLSGRKQTAHYELLYSNRAHMVLMIPSPILQLSLKLLQKMNINSFFHWKIVSNEDEAFDVVFKHRNGAPSTLIKHDKEFEYKPEQLVIPKTMPEISALVRQQHDEIERLKRTQHDNILRLIEYTGRMTWDESFTPPDLTQDTISPFNEVYNSLSVFFQDVKEILFEKQRDNQRLVESEEKYRGFINLASDIILVYQDDKIVFVNSCVNQILGYQPDAVIGKNMDLYVVADEIPRLRDYNIKRLNNIDVPSIYESVFLHANGQHVPVSMSVGRITYENRPAVMIIARDITQKKHIESELDSYRNHLEEIVKQRTNQLHKEILERKYAEESDRLKSAFLSNMSHEIRTPMNAIISFSNYLKDSSLTDEQREEFVGYIQTSGQSLLNLINDIIDLSKIESQQLRIQETTFAIDDLLTELQVYADTIRKSQYKSNITIKLSIPSSNNPIMLHSDQYRIRQIISNLINNALKFTDSGFIEFGYRIEEENIIIFVKDTGIGIPKDKLAFIFTRFGKLDSQGRNDSGTGLGLAISQNLATLLNGKLWVESNEGKGASFYLKMPITIIEKTVKQETPAIKPKGKYDWTKYNVLIAEDEDLNYKVLEIAIKKTGATVIRAFNGQEAVNIISKTTNIQIVLMDIQMPVMNGYDAMKNIKEINPSMPVIAQTAFALIDEQNKCLHMGFDDYVSKPINIEMLFSKMNAFLLKE